jgi:hypothetical protein
MLLTYFLNDFEMVPVAPIIIGITFVFTFHMRCISIVYIVDWVIFSSINLDSVTLQVESYEIITEVLLKIQVFYRKTACFCANSSRRIRRFTQSMFTPAA